MQYKCSGMSRCSATHWFRWWADFDWATPKYICNEIKLLSWYVEGGLAVTRTAPRPNYYS